MNLSSSTLRCIIIADKRWYFKQASKTESGTLLSSVSSPLGPIQTLSPWTPRAPHGRRSAIYKSGVLYLYEIELSEYFKAAYLSIRITFSGGRLLRVHSPNTLQSSLYSNSLLDRTRFFERALPGFCDGQTIPGEKKIDVFMLCTTLLVYILRNVNNSSSTSSTPSPLQFFVNFSYCATWLVFVYFCLHQRRREWDSGLDRSLETRNSEPTIRQPSQV